MAKRTSRKRHSRKRTSRNGWGRRASRGLKGKRRSRSKRTSRRNGLDRAKIQKALSHVHFVERSSENREGLSRVAAVKQAIADYKLSPDEADVLLSVTHVKRSKITANRSKRTSRRNTGYYYEGMSHPGSYDRRGRPVRRNRRRTSRRNQTFYIPIPPIKRNSRLSKKRRSKLPASKFVFPKDRAWPIESARGARDAIRYIKMGRVRSAADYMAIRNFIMKHYPAVWREYGLGASWQKTSAAKHKGMAHRRASMRRGHKIAANRRKRASRRNPEDYWTQQLRAGTAQRFYVHAGGEVRGPFAKAVAMRVAEHHRDLHKGRSPVKVTEVDRGLKEKTVKVVANRKRTSRR